MTAQGKPAPTRRGRRATEPLRSNLDNDPNAVDYGAVSIDDGMVSPDHKWLVGDEVEIEHEGNRYGGVIVRLNAKERIAMVRFEDGDNLAIDFDKLLKPIKKRRGVPLGDNGDDSTEDDDSSASAGNEDEDNALGTNLNMRKHVSREKDGDYKFSPPKKGARGMHHYAISWSPDGIYFNCWAAPDGEDLAITASCDELIRRLSKAKNKAIHFFGMWRKTLFHRVDGSGKILGPADVPGWSIDITGRITDADGKRQEYLVESINYEAGPGQGDPRRDMHLLNSDICAAIRKWFFLELRGDAETIRQLRRRADRPTIKVPSLRWLDTLLTKAREVRDTALGSGGERRIVIDSGIPGDPIIALQMDFTDMAIALDGKRVPSLQMGSVHEEVTRRGGKMPDKGRGAGAAALNVKADPENVAALLKRVAELNVKARAGDKAAKREAGKLRASLRNMGHTGGARAQPDKKAPPVAKTQAKVATPTKVAKGVK